MDPFRNGTDKKRFRTHIFVFFSTCNARPFFRYRSVTFFLKKEKKKKKPHHNTHEEEKQPFDCEVQYKGC